MRFARASPSEPPCRPQQRGLKLIKSAKVNSGDMETVNKPPPDPMHNPSQFTVEVSTRDRYVAVPLSGIRSGRAGLSIIFSTTKALSSSSLPHVTIKIAA
jgi:hypothetical protein